MSILYSMGGVPSYKNFMSAEFESLHFVLNELHSKQHLAGSFARGLWLKFN